MPDTDYVLQHANPSQVILGIEFETEMDESSLSMQLPYLKEACPEIVLRRAALDKRPCASNEALFAKPFVSDPHASITFTDLGKVFIQDLGSKNGTYILSGGKHHKLSRGVLQTLLDGDIIFLGNPALDDSVGFEDPVQLKVRFIKKTNRQIAYHSPGRYAAPVNLDSDSETEFGDPEHTSSRSSKLISPSYRLLSPLPIRARKLSPSTRVPALFEFPQIHERTTVDDSSLARPPSRKKSLQKIKVSDVMGHLEDIKTNILSLRDAPRFEHCDSDKIQEKLEGLEHMVNGFQEQQEKMARDQQEQLELIKSLQLELSLREPAIEPAKRKLEDGNEEPVEPKESDDSPPRSSSPILQTKRNKKQRPNQHKTVVGSAASTLGTLTAGAALMWWGLSSF